MSFLLDTHVLLWWFDSSPRLPASYERLIRDPKPEEPFWVSDISLWEIAMLVQLGRIRLRLPLRDWLEAATAPPLVRRIGISPAVAAEVAALPDTFHLLEAIVRSPLALATLLEAAGPEAEEQVGRIRARHQQA